MDDDGGEQVEPGHVVVLALAAVRQGDTLVAPKLDRLARSAPDARAIAGRLRELGVKLALGRTLYDPGDAMGKLLFKILATFAEFEANLIRMRTPKGIAIARAGRKLHGKQPAAVRRTAAGTLPHTCHGRVFHRRSRRALLSAQDQPPTTHSTGAISLSVRSCPLPESTRDPAFSLSYSRFLLPGGVGNHDTFSATPP